MKIEHTRSITDKRPKLGIRVLFDGVPMQLSKVADAVGVSYSRAYKLWDNKGRPRRINSVEFFHINPEYIRPGVEVRIKGVGKFVSYTKAAQAVGCSRATITRAVNKYGPTLTKSQVLPDAKLVLRRKLAKKRKRRSTSMPTDEWLMLSDKPRGM